MGTEVARRSLLLGIVAAVTYASCVQGAMYKCTMPEGKIAYQDSPCPSGSSEQSIRANVTPASPSTQKQPPIHVGPVPRSMYESAASPKIQKNIDAKGALETWDRFGNAFNRGDKSAAMGELTPAAQQRYGPVLDALMPPAAAPSARR
jgi:hypothetical protein